MRVADLDRAIRALKETPDVFWPNYLEELRPNSWLPVRAIRNRAPLLQRDGDFDKIAELAPLELLRTV